MIDFLTFGAILTALYYLLIRGYLWRFLLWSFGYYGLCITLDRLEFLHSAPIKIFEHALDWAVIIAFVITLLAIITTRVKKNE